MNADNEFYVISNTHWDREWRFPFERTRAMLVDMMDRLLGLLETQQDFRHFHLDAHTILLEDYLAVRPEKREALRRHVSSGRLLVGPWYTLPDACSCSGEALVRNLLRGHRLAEEFGKVTKVGYTPNGFGQPSQLPQLYAGFGIDNVLFYRGVPRHEVRSEFLWEGPDGTQALAFRFGVYARYNFFFLVYRPTVHGRRAFECEYRWEEGGRPFHLCRDLSYEPYYLLNFRPRFDADRIVPGLEEMVRVDAESMTTPLVAAMQGCDSTAPDDTEVRIIAEANRRLGAERVFHASLAEYVEKVRARVGGLQVVRGEMRHTLHSGGQTNLYPDIYGCRVYLRQANAVSEVRLEDRAEPAAAMAMLVGEPYPAGLLALAWKLLLENHAHDSIGGCAMDRVHEDVMNRYARCDDISDEVTRTSLAAVARRIGTAGLPADAILLAAFNTLPHARGEVVSATVDVPKGLDVGSVEIVDPAGRRVPCQLGPPQALRPTVQKPNDIPSPFHAVRYPVHLLLDEVPAMGYRTVLARPGKARGRWGPRLSPRRDVLENEHLRAVVHPDGTFDLLDKATGRLYGGLHAFEDGGEIGDPWNRIVPETDEVLTSRGGKARVRRVENGPLVARLEVEVTMRLPEGVTPDRSRRSAKRVRFPIRTVLELRRGSRLLDVTTTFDNVVRDHRLRVLLPTRLACSHSHAHMPFDVTARAVHVPDGAGWIEPPTGRCPQKWFVDVSDGAAGLAVLNEGITQYEVLEDGDRTLALTLMRCFQMRNTVQNIDYPDQGGSQCPGRHVYRYALLPHAGDWDSAGVLPAAARWICPPIICQIGGGEGPLPLAASFLQVTPDDLAFSGVKPAEDGGGLIVRLYNPTRRVVRGELRSRGAIAGARQVRLDETDLRPVPVHNGRAVPLEARPGEVVTVRLRFEPEG